jgi:hypothetical protein
MMLSVLLQGIICHVIRRHAGAEVGDKSVGLLLYYSSSLVVLSSTPDTFGIPILRCTFGHNNQFSISLKRLLRCKTIIC